MCSKCTTRHSISHACRSKRAHSWHLARLRAYKTVLEVDWACSDLKVTLLGSLLEEEENSLGVACCEDDLIGMNVL